MSGYQTLPPQYGALPSQPAMAAGPRVVPPLRPTSGVIHTVAAPVILEAKPATKASAGSGLTPRLVFLATGTVLLGLVSSVPIMNAVMLIMDMNYVFWLGVSIPLWMIFLSLGVILAYAITIWILFRFPRQQADVEHTILIIANIFITVLGLVLIFISMPLSRQSTETYENLMNKCDSSPQTMRTYEYSQVLHNIRSLPDCYSKYSVEECSGYEDAHPYTGYLKAMERKFLCSGFCYRPPAIASAALAQLGSNATELSASSASSGRSGKRRLLQNGRASLAVDDKAEEEEVRQPRSVKLLKAGYAPTLFSDANYQASCDHMAATDMKLFAGDIAHQTFYQGLYMVVIAIAMGFLRLIGFCIRADADK